MTERSEHQDIFDRIMSWEPLRGLQPFYVKYKQQLLYLFFGGLTFVLSIVSFWFLVYPCSMDPLVANIITWVICVAFAYWTNRTWVFGQEAHEGTGIAKEALSFVVGRLATLVLEELILWVGVDCLRIDSLLVKVLAQIAVIIGNYVISKFFVFNNSED